MNESLSTWERYRPYVFLVLAVVMGTTQIMEIRRGTAGVFDWLVLAGSVFILVNSVRELLARRNATAS